MMALQILFFITKEVLTADILRHTASSLAWLNPNDNFDLFEGDIILGKEDIRINDQNGIVLKSVHPFYHWPNGIVPYTLDKIFDNKEVQKIQIAMKEIESKSCIKFRQFDPSKDENYLAIVTFPSRCSSLVGLDPSEQPGQLLTLGEGCVKHPTIIHEENLHKVFYC